MLFLEKILGDPNEKEIKRKFWPLVKKINSLESELAAKSDEELKLATAEFKQQLAAGKKPEEILPEAFAVVRETAKRVLGQRHYDVQLIGGMVLNGGNIAEMRTGEGKTLTATLAVYLNALEGKGAHVVTVNDYLARRDAVWMGKVYDFLGLSVACIQHEKSYIYDAGAKASSSESPLRTTEGAPVRRSPPRADEGGGGGADSAHAVGLVVESTKVAIDYDHLRPVSRREAYAADITYGTNNEFGFDYLRDNMAGRLADLVQRELHFAIVDEVDSILIDEARTPLIISAPDTRPTDLYYRYAELVKRLTENEDYNVDEKMRSATLTEAGIKKMEEWLGIGNIYTEGGLESVHHIEQALKARTLFQLDRDYVIREGEVVIVDEFTGRMMPGRRYSEGLHQAIEAKENVEIKRESRTLATITFQNLFRMYDKLSGMTGTAKTEAEEFRKIYGLEVYVVPTNKSIARLDAPDRVYKSRQGKFQAVVNEIKDRHQKGQPVLVGTISIEQNEYFTAMLEKAGVPHRILNAKNHEREAEIIAEAGKCGAVTLATNMAGRGVDIILGGNGCTPAEAKEVKELGGLHVLGTERHESRRIDNQLRGRAGRQGDLGSSQFFVSVEDDLMRVFGSDRIRGMMNRLGIPDDMPIENKMVSRSIESAQKRVEGHNFDIRKRVVEYDDVVNRHREAIYRRRKEVLAALSPLPAQDESTHISPPARGESTHISPPARGGVGGEGEPASSSNLRSPRMVILEMVEQELAQVINLHTNNENYQDWNLEEISQTLATIFPFFPKEGDGGDIAAKISPQTLKQIIEENGERDKGRDAEMRSRLIDYTAQFAKEYYDSLVLGTGGVELEKLEQAILLNAIDTLWMDHLEALDNLRAAVGLRGYGQRDPLVEYKREGYRLFQELVAAIQNQVVYSIYKVLFAQQRAVQEKVMASTVSKVASAMGALKNLRFSAPAKTMSAQNEAPVAAGAGNVAVASEPVNRFEGKKVGRNNPCPCGSGKKFKKCHGA